MQNTVATANYTIEEWGIKTFRCPTDPGGILSADHLIEMRYFNGEKCNSCGLNVQAYWKTEYDAICFNMADETGEMLNNRFRLNWYCTCYSTHCHIDPSDPSNLNKWTWLKCNNE